MITALLTVFSKLDGQRRFVAPLLPAPLEAQTPSLDSLYGTLLFDRYTQLGEYLAQFVSQTIVYDPSHNVVKTHDSYRTMVVAFLFFQPIFHQRFSQRPNVTVKD